MLYSCYCLICLPAADADYQKMYSSLVGTTASDYPRAVAVDESTGDVYSAGYTIGAFPGYTNVGGSNDIYLMKRTSAGNVQWIKQVGTSYDDDEAYGLAVDSHRSAVYVTGRTSSSIINSQIRTGIFDAALIKFNTAGTPQWTKLYGSPGQLFCGYAVAVDKSAGSIFVAGTCNSQACLIKYNVDGKFLWEKRTAYTSDAFSIVLDSSGNVFLAGQGLFGSQSKGGHDIFVIKCTSAGDMEYPIIQGSSSEDAAYGIAIDIKNEYLYVTGFTQGSLNGMRYYGGSNAVLIKFDLSLNVIWTKQFVDQSYRGYTVVGRGVVVSSTNDIIITGYALPNSGQYDYFLAKFDSGSTSSEPVYYTYFNVRSAGQAYGIAQLDSAHDLYIVGSVSRSSISDPIIYDGHHIIGLANELLIEVSFDAPSYSPTLLPAINPSFESKTSTNFNAIGIAIGGILFGFLLTVGAAVVFMMRAGYRLDRFFTQFYSSENVLVTTEITSNTEQEQVNKNEVLGLMMREWSTLPSAAPSTV